MLYLVATPIGNLKEITYRAIEVLSSVDYIACEDTRTSKILLDNYNIRKPLVSYHKFNENKSGLEIVDDLKKGKNIAIISDAGTPGISDPGNIIVNMCKQQNIEYTVVFVDEDGKATHVGYIVADGSVVHALDYSHGVIKEKIDDRKEWNWFGRPSKLIEYDLTIDEFIDVTQLKKDDVITVSKTLKGYTTAVNAIYEQNPKTTCSPGEYFVYKVYRKSVNITKKKGKPGSWVVL